MSHVARPLVFGSSAWIVIISGSSLLFSRTFACVLPFAAIAAVAGSQLGRREAITAVLLAWLGNQAIGFGLLGYPHTWSAFAWGGMIGMAALCAAGAAAAAAPRSSRPLARGAFALLAAFLVYEAVLVAATFVLPASASAFAPAIIARIFETNVLAFIGLFAVHRVAVGFGLVAPCPPRLSALAQS